MAEFDIAVIGGGASGIAAAASAAKLGARVCLLEAQPRIGRKLLATGNGRCNITNSAVCAESYRSHSPEKIKEIMKIIPPEEVRSFIENAGLALVEEECGRMYPRGGQASAVLDMLRFGLDKLGVEVLCDFPVGKVHKENNSFVVSCADKKIAAKRVIFANGSIAAPQLGGSDSGMILLKQLGHSAYKFTPALVPLRCNMSVLRSLKGIRVRCSASLIYKGKKLYSDCGEVQFGDMLLSGIVIFQLSSRLARAGGSEAIISLDLLPELTYDETLEMLINRRKMLGYLTLENFLSGLLNKRIGACVIKAVTDMPMTETAEKLSDNQLKKVTKAIKEWSFTVAGTAKWQQAQVAAGGVSLAEFDGTLQSKLIPGIYACGELLDCDGDCGGYNLHWAWTSGILAGRSAASELKGKVNDKRG